MNKRNQLCNQVGKGLRNVPPVVRLAPVLMLATGQVLDGRETWNCSDICCSPAVSGPGGWCWDPVMGRSEPPPRVSSVLVGS